VLGPTQAPRFGVGSRASRGGINPAGGEERESDALAKLGELVVILAETDRIAGRLLQIFSRLREDSGLSGIEVLTLFAIAHAAGPPTVPQVGRLLGRPRQVIQRAVRVLENEGLVQALPNPGHKRAALLAATERGRELGARIDAQGATIIARLVDGLDLDLDMLAVMREGLMTLRRRIDEYIGASNA
jgi:DNA-binding MarR family transcriptional regulator